MIPSTHMARAREHTWPDHRGSPSGEWVARLHGEEAAGEGGVAVGSSPFEVHAVPWVRLLSAYRETSASDDTVGAHIMSRSGTSSGRPDLAGDEAGVGEDGGAALGGAAGTVAMAEAKLVVVRSTTIRFGHMLDADADAENRHRELDVS